MTEAIGQITYNRAKPAESVETTLETECRATFVNGLTAKLEWFLTLDPAAVAQQDTITITLGSIGDEYQISITVAGATETYEYEQVAGDTADLVASDLAARISQDTRVEAIAAANVITVTSSTPGQAFTTANTGSTTPANLVIATTTANSGTPKHRKIAETEVILGVATNGIIELTHRGKFYDGAATPVQLAAYGPLKSNSTKTLSEIQTTQGVPVT